MKFIVPPSCATLFALACITIRTVAGDWPAYKHDPQRSSVTTEALSLPLRVAWQYTCAQPPSPAWPDTFKLLNRTDFDYAPHPVVANGIVCFGSSSDDTVRALDAKTGKEKWHFIAGGPVRLAPQIEGGRVFFASDDGFAYCLDAGTGKLVWIFRVAPQDERMVGNHRMISRWPVRTGVLVADGVAYCVAGMWNMEGVFVHALAADTGKPIWCNDTLGLSNVTIVDFPESGDPSKPTVGGHNGEFAANGSTGSNPQGPLLLAGNALVIPNANAAPTALDRRTGALTPHGAGGGTPVTIDGEKVYFFAKHHEDVLSFHPFSLTTGAAGRGWGKDALPQVRITTPKTGQVHDRSKVSAIVRNEKLFARAAYGLALAAETLLVGGDGTIAAQDPDTEREMWRASVSGEAREIAVADGRMFVGTSAGVIYCFEPAVKGSEKPALVHEPAKEIRPQSTVPTASARIIEQLRGTGMDRGFALVLGDPDGSLSTALAARTQLRIVNALPDESAAATLRERLLTSTNWHGSRVHVQTVARMDQLPFAQFFANAVIIAGPVPGLSAKELYRVLHPCGGMLLAPGLKPAEAEALLKNSGIAESEIRKAPEGSFVVRGKLPGALDWDSNWKETPPAKRITADQRVKWPLRPLWYGGPGTTQVHHFVGTSPAPVIANGRYFLQSENLLTAVDAYNGELLWSRPIPKASPASCAVDGLLYPVIEPVKLGKLELMRRVHADDDSVYLVMGRAYLQPHSADGVPEVSKSKDEFRIQLDARTGEQKKVAAPFNPPPIVSLNKPQTWRIEAGVRRTGDVTMESTARGLLLTLATTDPMVTKLDAWELFFDFRVPDARFGLYERGTFQVRIAVARDKNTPASWSPGAGPAHPAIEVSGTREPSGTKTTVLLPWAEIEKLTGAKPTSFGFAATLDSNDGGKDEVISRNHLFCDWAAGGLNNGWANIVLEAMKSQAEISGRPAIIVDSLPGTPALVGNGEIISADREAPRVHPLTGELEPKMFRIAGCGGLSGSSFLRSGSESIYDFADDSGMRPMGGVKARCSTPQIAALGLLMFSEENGHCECPFPVRTSLVLAPAERRLNEDWAFFFARPVDTQVRQAAINFGAPGDRRDADGTLWLGYPRIPGDKSLAFPLPAAKQRSVGANGVWLRIMSASLQLPVEVECFGDAAYRPQEDLAAKTNWQSVWLPGRNQKDFGPYRISADRAGITGTDRPWIYASGYRGIRKASVKLDFLPPVVSAPLDKSPADKPEGPHTTLPFTKAEIFVRHTADSLHITAQRPPVLNRRGEVSPWTKATSGEDANVWDDDSFEIFLGDATRVMHLGVSASGARFDALAEGAEDKPEDKQWNASWTSKVVEDKSGLVFQLTIPWKTIEAAGLKRDRLGVNFQMNQRDISGQPPRSPGVQWNPKFTGTSGEAICYLGIAGREHCRNFAPLGLGALPKLDPHKFTVRLHFAELDDVKPGERVFDVKLQDQMVAKGLDVVAAAGGPRKAHVREFPHVLANETLKIEFTPTAKTLTLKTAPILSALEFFDEDLHANAQ